MKKYLNNLCRKNFSGYSNGKPYSHFINKNKPIYEELFPKTNNNNSLTIKTISNSTSPNKIIKTHRRYNSAFSNVTIDLENEENTKIIPIHFLS